MKLSIISLALATTYAKATSEVEYMNEIQIMPGHTKDKRSHIISPLPHT